MKNHTVIWVVVVIAIVVATLGLFISRTLGSSIVLGVDNYAVLGGSTITNTGASSINGDLGLSPGTSVTGFPPGILNGTQQVANLLASEAQDALTEAYNDVAGEGPVTTIPTELGGTTINAGVYDSEAGTFGITGTLTLDGQGNNNSVFVFQMASTLTTGGESQVQLINGAKACNVYWQVGSSATLGASSDFEGNILALESITLTTGARVTGRVLARNGAVTLDTNTITKSTCAKRVILATPKKINPTTTATSTRVEPNEDDDEDDSSTTTTSSGGSGGSRRRTTSTTTNLTIPVSPTPTPPTTVTPVQPPMWPNAGYPPR